MRVRKRARSSIRTSRQRRPTRSASTWRPTSDAALYGFSVHSLSENTDSQVTGGCYLDPSDGGASARLLDGGGVTSKLRRTIVGVGIALGGAAPACFGRTEVGDDFPSPGEPEEE